MNSFLGKLSLLIVSAFLISFTGCKKEEAPKATETAVSQPVQDTAKKTAAPVEQTVEVKGTWAGTFNNYPSTLEIKEQTGSKFSGVLTIKSREAEVRPVKGEVNAAKSTITMSDTKVFREAGSYSASLSKDGKSFSGLFSSNVGKASFSISFKKTN